MAGIMSDNDVEGHVQYLVTLIEAGTWGDLWKRLNVVVGKFEDLGLPRNTPDRFVWRRCQEHEIVLITGNRNSDGPDALEVTIQDSNTPTSLPVVTIGDLDHLKSSKEYAERAADKLMDYLLYLDEYRGAGRLYIS